MKEFVRKHWLVLLLLILTAYVMTKVYQATSSAEKLFQKLLAVLAAVMAAIVTESTIAQFACIALAASILNDIFSFASGINWVGWLGNQFTNISPIVPSQTLPPYSEPPIVQNLDSGTNGATTGD